MEGTRLGLKDYWEEAYCEEIKNLDDFGDEGEVWCGLAESHLLGLKKAICRNKGNRKPFPLTFNGEGKDMLNFRSVNDVEKKKVVSVCLFERFGEDVLETMVEFTEDVARSSFQKPENASFVDIGTGNGVFLHELASLGFSSLFGTDYSPLAIELSKKLAVKKGFKDIRFVVDDVLASTIEERFDVACDKGTFDAVGLAPDGLQKRLQYIMAVGSLLKPDGLLIMTSCNSTKDELVQEFEGSQLFRYHDHVKTYPTFTFGGQEGSRVATVAFQRTKS